MSFLVPDAISTTMQLVRTPMSLHDRAYTSFPNWSKLVLITDPDSSFLVARQQMVGSYVSNKSQGWSEDGS